MHVVIAAETMDPIVHVGTVVVMWRVGYTTDREWVWVNERWVEFSDRGLEIL